MRINSRYILILCIVYMIPWYMSSCRPKGILHSWEMRDVLVDLHKTEALIQVSGLQYGHDEAQNIYYAQVMEKHGITQAQFDSSLVWYTAHPLFFDKIYPKVQAQLKEEHDAFMKEHASELNLSPQMSVSDSARTTLTRSQLDSLIWVNHSGSPTTWRPWVPPYRLCN